MVAVSKLWILPACFLTEHLPFLQKSCSVSSDLRSQLCSSRRGEDIPKTTHIQAAHRRHETQVWSLDSGVLIPHLRSSSTPSGTRAWNFEFGAQVWSSRPKYRPWSSDTEAQILELRPWSKLSAWAHTRNRNKQKFSTQPAPVGVQTLRGPTKECAAGSGSHKATQDLWMPQVKGWGGRLSKVHPGYLGDP